MCNCAVNWCDKLCFFCIYSNNDNNFCFYFYQSALGFYTLVRLKNSNNNLTRQRLAIVTYIQQTVDNSSFPSYILMTADRQEYSPVLVRLHGTVSLCISERRNAYPGLF